MLNPKGRYVEQSSRNFHEISFETVITTRPVFGVASHNVLLNRFRAYLANLQSLISCHKLEHYVVAGNNFFNKFTFLSITFLNFPSGVFRSVDLLFEPLFIKTVSGTCSIHYNSICLFTHSDV